MNILIKSFYFLKVQSLLEGKLCFNTGDLLTFQVERALIMVALFNYN